jgi:uroporphyrinogen-III synthase
MATGAAVPWSLPEPSGFDAVLLGSANAVGLAGPQLAQLRGRQAAVVGEATAQAARAAGLDVIAVGAGGLQSVIDVMDAGGPRRLLRLAGEEHTPLVPPAGVTILTRTVYRMVYHALPDQALAALRNGALVLLHSGVAAQHFASECTRLGLDRSMISLAVLAPRIAEAAGHGWRALAIAPQPNDRALLELACDMCQ